MSLEHHNIKFLNADVALMTVLVGVFLIITQDVNGPLNFKFQSRNVTLDAVSSVQIWSDILSTKGNITLGYQKFLHGLGVYEVISSN